MAIFRLLQDYREALVAGLTVTLQLCALIWSIGLVLGWAIGVASARWPRAIGLPARSISFMLAGTPVLLALYYAHYPIQEMLRVAIDPFKTAAAVLSTYTAFGIADLVRDAWSQFPRQYLHAARACGLSRRQTFWRILLPLVLRHTLPGHLALAAIALQTTLFAAYISVEELFRVSLSINAREHLSVPVFSLVGLFFLVICLPLQVLAFVFARKLRYDASDR